MGFSSVPVVNMAGKIIGMIPKNFIIVLIENHAWYEHELTRHDSREVTSFYKTHVVRQESISQSNDNPFKNNSKNASRQNSLLKEEDLAKDSLINPSNTISKGNSNSKVSDE